MAKARRTGGAAERLEALLRQGNHRAARAEAGRLLADAATAEPDRQAAAEALHSLRPEPGAVAVGLGALAAAAAIAAWLLHG